MKRLAEVQSHIASMGSLSDLVGAMRPLASMRMQEAQRALPAARRYAQSVAGAVADSLLLSPPVSMEVGPRTAWVLCLAEHGFVGAFNRQLIDAAAAVRAKGDHWLVLGSRGAAVAEEHGQVVQWLRPMASHCAAVPEAVEALAGEIYRLLAEGHVDRVELLNIRFHGNAPGQVARRRLLPVEPTESETPEEPGKERFRQLPLHNLAPRQLQEQLLAEYVFARLSEAAVESLASENAARFAAMASAFDNVSGKLQTLHHEANQARQEEITTELLDLVVGAMALEPGHDGRVPG